MDTEQIWQAALNELQLQMTRATFDTLLRDSRLLKWENGVFVVGVKSGYAKDWLEHRLLPVIKRTLARLTDRTAQTVEIKFVVTAPPDELSAARGSDHEDEPAEHQASGSEKGERLIVEAIYGEERNRLIKPDNGSFLLWYEIDYWLPRLGGDLFTLVQVLRRCAHGKESNADGTRSVPIDGKELSARLGVSERTIKNWLDAEPIPGEKGWFRIRGTDPKRVALSEFIPKITYDSAGCRVILVRMDTPLLPEDRPRLDNMVRARLSRDGMRSPAEEVSDMLQGLNMSVEDGRVVRSMVLPIAKRTAELFGDTHSTKMYYRVLMALYRARRLDLFLEALQVAMLDMYPGGNPGASFVNAIQELGNEDGVDVGIGHRGSNEQVRSGK